MGEIAESMLGGEMCEACGEYLNCMLSEKCKDPCSEIGIPMYCSEECANELGIDESQVCKHR